MRILIAHSSYRVAGGEDGYVQRQVKLLRLHHDVDVLARPNDTLQGGLRTAVRMTWSPGSLREVDALIGRSRPDVVHLHNAYPGLGPAVHLAAERRRIPLVMTVHNTRLRCPNGLMFTEGSPCRRCENGAYAQAVLHGCFPTRRQAAAYAVGLWTHRFVLSLERRVAIYVAPSAFMTRQLLQWGIPAERVETVPNFTPLPSDASAEPGSYGLYLGRLAVEKGLDVLLRALRQAGDPPFRIVGDGPMAAQLGLLKNRLGLRNTEFAGFLAPSAIPEAIRAARFVALPSTCTENAPLAALEAMAAGRPLLTSAIGGLPELVGGGAGVSCRPGDVLDLARGIRELMRDDALCREAGTRALDYATANLRPDLHLRRLETVYDIVTATRAAAAHGT